ncbi:hypothetical protein M9Y10_043847 [Tritrichomonas musculus]|uniref:Uncharacterized protein n=1 Tax=Tritrichomonas musculus TaxID=1915356 RepID=A0ABR2K197_9EUKA
MNGVYSPGSCEAHEVLAHREKELNELLNNIDSLQEEVDDLNQKISTMNYEIAKSERENYRSRKIKNAIDNEPYHTKNRNVDDSMFSGEHLEYLREKRNLIADLGEQINKLHNSMAPDEESLLHLQQQNAYLLCEQSNTRKELQKVQMESKRLDEEISIIKSQLKELNIEITNKERLRRDAEAAVSGLIYRKELLYKDNTNKDTQAISTLEIQTAILQESNSRLQQDIDNSAKLFENDKQTINDQFSFVHNKINWTQEQNNLKNELKNVQQQLAEIRSSRDEVINAVNEIEGRFNKLLPIINKWSNKLQNTELPEEDDENIDFLLQQYQRKLNGTKKNSKKEIDNFDNIVAENTKLEAKIARKQEELNRQMVRFLAEQSQIKNNIQACRNNSFEEEHRIIEQINKLNVKLAKMNQV